MFPRSAPALEDQDLFIIFEDRPSDSPYIERVWRSHSVGVGTFTSVATSSFGIVVTRHNGKTFLTVRGPESKATPAECPAGGEWIGVHFKIGTFMPTLLPGDLRDRNDVNLPAASDRTFRLEGTAWEYPTFENVDTFVARLVRQGLIAKDPCVEIALRDEVTTLSRRAVQRRFLHATGMTQQVINQIERARRATCLLRCGTPVLQVVHDLGYFDQAHLTRSLKRFVGHTPAQIARGNEQLSLLYKT